MGFSNSYLFNLLLYLWKELPTNFLSQLFGFAVSHKDFFGTRWGLINVSLLLEILTLCTYTFIFLILFSFFFFLCERIVDKLDGQYKR